MEQEQKENQNVFDLENQEHKEQLIKDSESGSSNFFKLEPDTTYKVIVTSPKIERVVKKFNDDEVVKHQIQIKSQDKEGNVFEGIWEVGNTVLNTIVKSYSINTTYKVTKTGEGKKTRYSVVVDF